MEQELDSIDVGENPRLVWAGVGGGAGLARAGCAVILQKGAHLLAIKPGPAIAELLFKGLAQRVDIAVFAKDEGNDQPIITRADLAVLAMVAEKSTVDPSFDVRSFPGVVAVAGSESGRVMHHIGGSEQSTACDRLAGPADGDAVHPDLGAWLEIHRGELVLGRNVHGQRIIFAGDSFAGRQVRESHQHIVARIELDSLHCVVSPCAVRADKSHYPNNLSL